MHINIFEQNQLDLLPFIKKYKKNYYMVGGTAIALIIGHRRSIDFDMFTFGKINVTYLKKQVSESKFSSSVIHALPDQIHFIINNVKLTFFEYPFFIDANDDVNGIFRMPNLLTLAAMKAFALGGRGKWKDYVDLYFIIKDFYNPQQISDKAKELFTDVFNPTLFRKQLCYFKDINYTEQVEYMPGFKVPEDEIKAFLIEASLTGF